MMVFATLPKGVSAEITPGTGVAKSGLALTLVVVLNFMFLTSQPHLVSGKQDLQKSLALTLCKFFWDVFFSQLPTGSNLEKHFIHVQPHHRFQTFFAPSAQAKFTMFIINISKVHYTTSFSHEITATLTLFFRLLPN